MNYSTSEVSELTFENEFQSKRLSEVKETIKLIEKFVSCEVVHTVSGTHYQHTDIFLQTTPFPIKIRYWDYTKKFVINQDFKELKNIDFHTISSIQENIKKPTTIGILSTKKINAWIDYHNEVYVEALKINNVNLAEINEFKASLIGKKVVWNSSGNQGVIVNNGVTFEFTIEPTNISKKININYNVENTLEMFEALSNNQYKK
jgi:hypothetical protein